MFCKNIILFLIDAAEKKVKNNSIWVS